MTISTQLQEIYASAPSDVRHIETLQFEHPQFPKTYYVTNDEEAWMFTDENNFQRLFESLPFEARLPESSSSGKQELELVLSNVGLEMMQALEAANAQPEHHITCTYRVYLDIPLSTPQNDPPLVLSITEVSATELAIVATATRFDVLSRPFPSVLYRPDTFPGLKR